MNENFRSLKENDHLTVLRIQSCNDFSVALMSNSSTLISIINTLKLDICYLNELIIIGDGLLYAMGDNMEG